MATFPIQLLNRVFADAPSLAAELAARAQGNVLEHPGQRYPVEAIEGFMRQKSTKRALAEACALLLRDATDPDVLLLCAHLGGGGHLPYYEALIERLLNGPPLPNVPGSARSPLPEQLVRTLKHEIMGKNTELQRRAVDALRDTGHYRARLSLLCSFDPDRIVADATIEALHTAGAHPDVHPDDAHVIRLGAWATAHREPSRLLDVARAMASQPPELQQTIAHTIATANPDWWKAHKAAFAQELSELSTGALDKTPTEAERRTEQIQPLLAFPTEQLGAIADLLTSLVPSDPQHPWRPSVIIDPEIALEPFWVRVSEAVAELVAHNHPVIASQAARVLGLAPTTRGRAALAQALASSDPEVQSHALSALADQDPTLARKHALVSMHHNAPDLRVLSVHVLAYVGGDDVANALLHRWNSENEPIVQAALLRAIGALDPAAALPLILQVLHEPSTEPSMVNAAWSASAGLASPERAELERAARAAREPKIRWRLLSALDAAGAPPLELAEELFREDPPLPTRIEVAAWLAGRDGPIGRIDSPAWTLLCESSDDPNTAPLRRVQAAAWRARLGDGDAFLLIMHLWFHNSELRSVVRDALLAAPAFEDWRIRVHIKSAAKRPEIGAAAAELLRVRGGGAVLAELREAATNPDPWLARAAIATLWAYNDDAAPTTLLERLQAMPPSDRIAWVAEYHEHLAPLPEGLIIALINSDDAAIRVVGLTLLPDQRRKVAARRLDQMLAHTVERVRGARPPQQASPIHAPTQRSKVAEFLTSLRGARPPQRASSVHALMQRPKVAELLTGPGHTVRDRLAQSDRKRFAAGYENTWLHPDATEVAAAVAIASTLQIVEVAPRLEELAASSSPEIQLHACIGLHILAPWRLDSAIGIPDPSGLVTAIRRLSA